MGYDASELAEDFLDGHSAYKTNRRLRQVPQEGDLELPCCVQHYRKGSEGRSYRVRREGDEGLQVSLQDP